MARETHRQQGQLMLEDPRIVELSYQAHAEIRQMAERAREELARRVAFAKRSLGQRTRYLKHLFPK